MRTVIQQKTVINVRKLMCAVLDKIITESDSATLGIVCDNSQAIAEAEFNVFKFENAILPNTQSTYKPTCEVDCDEENDLIRYYKNLTSPINISCVSEEPLCSFFFEKETAIEVAEYEETCVVNSCIEVKEID